MTKWDVFCWCLIMFGLSVIIGNRTVAEAPQIDRQLIERLVRAQEDQARTLREIKARCR